MSAGADDAYEELARELRQGVGAEWRDEAEITERETHLGSLRKRRLADVAREAMHRGDIVTVLVGGWSVKGAVMFVGGDYLVLQTSSQMLDIVLDRAVMRIEPQHGGGHTTRGGSATFKARLAEYEQTGEPVTLHLRGASQLTGRIVVAAVDHCITEDTDGARSHIPIALIEMISRPRE